MELVLLFIQNVGCGTLNAFLNLRSRNPAVKNIYFFFFTGKISFINIMLPMLKVIK